MKSRFLIVLLLIGGLWAASEVLARGPNPAPAPPPCGSRGGVTASVELQIGWRQVGALFRGLAGIPMWGLVVCGVMVLTFAVDRLVVLQARRVAPPVFTKRFLQHLREEEINGELACNSSTSAGTTPSVIARLYGIVIENYGRTSFEIRTADRRPRARVELSTSATHPRPSRAWRRSRRCSACSGRSSG